MPAGELLDRKNYLFEHDIDLNQIHLQSIVSQSSFLILGGAGSIGQAVTKEIFKRNPQKLHVVDISENNLVELVRDIRSSLGYIEGDFQTFALDIGSDIFDAFIEQDGNYDYVINLSALKHVRSEKDPYTLMRMVEVNILNTIKTIDQAIKNGAKKYFCVSTDKAANPVNMMGASKRIMEMFLMQKSELIPISTARFANVAFSDGSLLHSFKQRLEKNQPIVAPNDVKRYFVSATESGQLCMLSTLLGENRDIFFPKLEAEKHLTKFSDLAVRFLKSRGFEPQLCDSEEEARDMMHQRKEGSWPCYFSPSDTTGEKDFEEFYTSTETLDMKRFEALGVIQHDTPHFDSEKLKTFLTEISTYRKKGQWNKEDLVQLFFYMIPDFNYEDKKKYLDSKM